MSLAKIKQNASDMNEIILAPCDVISKIKQNSSDMNEIILASCDAGYVQSCTGSMNTHQFTHVGGSGVENFLNFERVPKHCVGHCTFLD
jgi:hypothetical protein